MSKTVGLMLVGLSFGIVFGENSPSPLLGGEQVLITLAGTITPQPRPRLKLKPLNCLHTSPCRAPGSA